MLVQRTKVRIRKDVSYYASKSKITDDWSIVDTLDMFSNSEEDKTNKESDMIRQTGWHWQLKQT
jgi:hypothetical protein